MTLRLAVWSGPRNISTAMMRAWENREDTAVVDEPFYAHYLLETQLDHPAAGEVMRRGELDWRKVVATLLGPAPGERAVWYQKHMTHHMLPHIARDFLSQLVNVFLIRDPREVVSSYAKSRPGAKIEARDIGLPQEASLIEHVRRVTGATPIIIDTGDFLHAPEAHLRAWCDRIGVGFSNRMLQWPPGPRDTDGVWAPHWYEAVWKSTGFEPWQERDLQVAPEHAVVVEQAMPHYHALRAQRLVP